MNTDSDPEVREVLEKFWASIVCPNGKWDFRQVKRELYDYYIVMREVGLAYDEVTNGKFSKPNTDHRHVVDAVEQRIKAEVAQGRKDLISDLLAVLKAYKSP